jgi:thiol-disulfide isomerase/thioredoxin
MKKILLLAALFITTGALAQAPEISRDEHGTKILKGFITKQDLATDTAFTWFSQNQQGYVPEQAALQTFRANKDSISFIAFGGTWCDDTKFILPKFFVLADAAGLPQEKITVIGVDHNKKTIQHLSETFGIVNVPTIIVMKNGKEVGRVVEYGRYGMFDKELGEIIRNAK